MYNLISNIIDHVWQTQNLNSTEQQIIYTTCCILICVFSFVVIDLVYRLISAIIHRAR